MSPASWHWYSGEEAPDDLACGDAAKNQPDGHDYTNDSPHVARAFYCPWFPRSPLLRLGLEVCPEGIQDISQGGGDVGAVPL